MRLLSRLAGVLGVLALAAPATAAIRVGAPAGCAVDPDCAPALARAYGIDVLPALVALAPGAATYRALRAGQVDVVVARTTDPEARDPDLHRLADERAATPVDVVAPILRRAALLDRPELEDALAPLGRRLSTRDLVALGLALRRGRPPADAAATVLARLRLSPVPTSGPPVRVLADPGPEGRAVALVAVGALRAAGLAARVSAVAPTPAAALRALERDQADVWPTRALALLDHLTGSRGTRGADLATGLDLLRGVLAAHRATALDARSARTRRVLLTTRSTAATLGLARVADLVRPELGLPLVEPVAAPAATDPGPLPPLAPGALGRSIAALQSSLVAIGYDPGPPSGAYGERTRRAVLALQEGAGLPADGVADDATLAAIERRTLGPAGPTTPGRCAATPPAAPST
ncbi:MAG: glycine betaine ABC transporter substrate-binding protein [Thermoleophilia bacterium]